jgi:multicomponent Na+:H+ antiporter subunit G
MIEMIVDGLSWLLLAGGGFFVLVGGVGVMRMPDLYTRIHAAFGLGIGNV